jgi:hypothetical protein
MWKLFSGKSEKPKTTTIVTGGHKLGKIGERRMGIAMNHVCQSLKNKYSKPIENVTVNMSPSDGGCVITITPRNKTNSDICQEIGQYANALLETEVLYQRSLDKLISLVSKYDLTINVAELLGAAKEEVSTVGREINNYAGFNGMMYVGNLFGELYLGLLRTLEFAWNGIGGWSA